jgi:hypothetical protein
MTHSVEVQQYVRYDFEHDGTPESALELIQTATGPMTTTR